MTWGEIQGTTKSVAINDPIWFIAPAAATRRRSIL